MVSALSVVLLWDLKKGWMLVQGRVCVYRKLVSLTQNVATSDIQNVTVGIPSFMD